MKKRKLKTWVKVTLGIIMGLLFILMNNNYYNKAMNDCLNAGHTEEYCEIGLR